MMSLVCFTSCQGKNASYDKAMEYAEQEKYEEALPLFEEAIKENGTNPDYYIGYGMALNRLMKYSEAENIFSQILKSDVDMSDGEKKQIYYGISIASYGQGDYGAVEKYAKKALELTSVFKDLDRDIRYTEAVSLFLDGQTDEAGKLCETMLTEESDDMDAYMLYGGIKKAKGDTEGAIQIYESAIKADNKYYEAYFSLYEQYISLGQNSAAEELLGRITSMDAKKEEELLAVGKAWYYKKNYDTALEYFEKVEKAGDAGSKKGLYYIGLIKRIEGQLTDAEAVFLNYITEDKDDLIPEVYNQLAGIYMERSKYKKAQSMLTKGMALGDTSAMQNLLRNQVILFELQGSYDKAKQAAKTYLKTYSDDVAMKKELSFIKTRI